MKDPILNLVRSSFCLGREITFFNEEHFINYVQEGGIMTSVTCFFVCNIFINYPAFKYHFFFFSRPWSFLLIPDLPLDPAHLVVGIGQVLVRHYSIAMLALQHLLILILMQIIIIFTSCILCDLLGILLELILLAITILGDMSWIPLKEDVVRKRGLKIYL